MMPASTVEFQNKLALWDSAAASKNKQSIFGKLPKRFRREKSCKIAIFPGLKGTYARLCYAGLFDPNAVLGVGSLEVLNKVRNDYRIPLLLLNWEEQFLYPAPIAAQKQQARAVIAALQALQQEGTRLVLTLHNATPHKSHDAEAFSQLRRAISEMADMVIVHSNAAHAYMSAHNLTEPEKITLLPHPSYLDFLKQTAPIRRPSPRPKLLCFGTVRAYKGYENLIEALLHMDAKEAFGGITFAGRKDPNYTLPLDRLAQKMQVVERYEEVPETALHALFAQHEFVALNYQDSLTSGVALMGLSHATPMIAPNLGNLTELLDGPLAELRFDPDAADGLQNALKKAACATSDAYLAMSEHAYQRAQELRAADYAVKFANALRERGLWSA